MPMPTTIETDGFLSDEIVEVIREFKAQSPKLHEDFRRLNRLAHQRKNTRPVSNTDVQELMIVLLIGKRPAGCHWVGFVEAG